MLEQQNRIKQLRKARKWSQAELGNRVGLSQTMIADYETGRKNPSRKASVKIAQIFGVSIDYLLGYSVHKIGESYQNDENNIDIREIKRSVTEKKLLYDGEELPPLEQEIIRRMILFWVEQQEKRGTED